MISQRRDDIPVAVGWESDIDPYTKEDKTR